VVGDVGQAVAAASAAVIARAWPIGHRRRAMGPSGFRKRVSTIEKLYLAYNTLRPPFVNQVTLEAEGRVDRAGLAAALATATAANPGSALKMRGHLGLRSWVVGPAPRLTFVSADWDGRSDAGAPFLAAPLDGQKGPSCELQVIEAGAARTFLIFRSLHAVMDGLGTLLWAQDVFRALRGEAPIGHPGAMTDTELAAGLNPAPLQLTPADALTPAGRADAKSSGNEFRWQRTTITDPNEVNFVAAVAVAAAAAARRHGPGKVRMNVPADLRFFHKEERTTGNAVGTLFVDVPEDATVESLTQSLRDRLRAKEHARFPANYERLRWAPLGAFMDFAKKSLAKEHETGQYGLSGTISYLGVVEPSTITAPGLTPKTIFWIPPACDQNFFVSGSRFAGHLELILSLPRVLASHGRFEALLAEVTAAVRRPGAPG
jgi:hypothetical protein